jgi:hypothetical protein
MSDYFLPNGDAELLAWSSNFSNRISDSPGSLGLDPEQAAQYASLHGSYASGLTAAGDPATRTRGSVAAKNDARRALKASARQLARIVKAHPAVTVQQRIDLGLSPRTDGGAAPAIHPPDSAPHMQIVYTSGRLVKVRLRQTGAEGRGRPAGTQGLIVFSLVGPTASADPSAWAFERCSSRTHFDIEIGAKIAPGAKVWLAACWYNPRGQRGPMSVPVSTYIGDGVAQAA